MDRYLTIFADASFCWRTRAGGWGAWIKGEGESITAGGSFPELHRSSQEAELAALVNAVSAAKDRNLLDPGLIVMLQSDCEAALAAILRNRPQTVQRPIKGGHVIRRGISPRATDSEAELFGLDWVIVGGESGPRARPMHPNWVRQIRDDCARAGVLFFFKQWGEWGPDEIEGGRLLRFLRPNGDQGTFFERGCVVMERRGKKAAGRKLDGIEHLFWPAERMMRRAGT